MQINNQQITINNISFNAMKKSQFHGLNLGIVERYKAPIEKFNNFNDYERWAESLTKKILHKNLSGRHKETFSIRKARLQTWTKYIDVLPKGIQLLILSNIVKNLDENNDNLPPELNKEILEQSLNEIEQILEKDPKQKINLSKLYKNNLQKFYLKSSIKPTGWVVIPSKYNDTKNHKSNIEKLKLLSSSTWCTKDNFARDYIEEGDFHIYLENGKPKIGMRFFGNEVEEIQGCNNDSIIPSEYLDCVIRHIKENNIKTTDLVQMEIESSRYEKAKQLAQTPTPELLDLLKDKKYYDALIYLGLNIKKDNNNLFILPNYTPFYSNLFKQLNIDENDLFKNIKSINKHADFSESYVTDLGNLENINGYAIFQNSQIKNLGKLKRINGNAYFADSPITNLKFLEHIYGDMYIHDSNIHDFGNLQYVDGTIFWGNADIQNFGKLENIKEGIL